MKIVRNKIDHIIILNQGNSLQIREESLKKLYVLGSQYYRYGEIVQDGTGFYVAFNNCVPYNQDEECYFWSELFYLTNKMNFVRDTLGYYDLGIFPYCRNMQDVIKLLNSIIEKIIYKK